MDVTLASPLRAAGDVSQHVAPVAFPRPGRSPCRGMSVRETVLAVVRVVWLALAVANVLVGRFGRVVLAVEVVLLATLVARSHVSVTCSLDRDVAAPNVLVDFRSARALVTVTALAYAGALLWTGAVAPAGEVTDTSRTILRALQAAFAVLALSAVTIGGYLLRRHPGTDGGFARVARTLLAVAPPAKRRREVAQLDSALAGRLPAGRRAAVLGSFVLAIGTVVSLVAFPFGVLGALLLTNRALMVAAVVGWLLYDVARADRPGVGTWDTFRGLGTRIGRVDRLLFDLEVRDGGLKAVFALTFVVCSGLFVSVLLGALGVATTAEGVTAAGLHVIAVLGAPGSGSSPSDGPSLLVAVGGTVAVAVVTLALAGYSFLVWYVLARRLPTWVGGVEGPVTETVALPRRAGCAYPLAVGTYFWLVGRLATVGSAPPVARTVALLGVLSVVVLGLLVDGVRTVRRVSLPATGVEHDNYRIILYSVVVFGAGLALVRPRAWSATAGFLVGLAGVYFVPDAVAAIGDRVGSPLLSGLAIDAYVVVAAAVVVLSVRQLYPALRPLTLLIPAAAVLLFVGTLFDHFLL